MSSSVSQFGKNSRRFGEIAGVLVKYGLATWIPEQYPEFVKGRFKTLDGVDLVALPQGTRLRLALTELGPTFIKLGQVLSTRVDLVGPEVANELAELQSGTPPDAPEVVRNTVEAELGKPVEDLFAEFHDEALGSASIGQVHVATLPDGQEVIVKVQHAGIEDKVTADLDILLGLAELAEHYDPSLRYYQPKATVGEFRRSLLKELDFRRERQNVERFTRNFTDRPEVHFPLVFPEYSTRRILVMERLVGYSIAKTDRLAQEGVDGKALINIGADMYIKMIFQDSFFHADPHPGNLWVLAGDVLGVLDCGMVGRLDGRTRSGVEDLLMGVFAKDPEQLTDVVTRLGKVPPNLNRGQLQADIEEFVAEHVGLALSEFDSTAALNALTEIIRTHHILLPTGVSSLLRLLVMLEGTIRILDPDFNLMEALQARQGMFTQKHLSIERFIQRVYRSYRDWERLLEMLPRELADLLESFRAGELDVHLDVRRLDPIVNRLVYGVLSAALFMGSSRMLGAGVPPLIEGVSALGAGGLVLSLVLGLRLVRAIKNSGNLEEKKH